MKKLIYILAILLSAPSTFALSKALYVKQGDNITKYSFGVAGNLNFSNNGKTLNITGYNDIIDLDKVDYISFNAPVDASALTPAAQKNKLIEIGEDLNSMIDLRSNSDLINMYYTFFEHYEDADGNYHHPACEFEVPEEYYDVHKAISKIAKSIRDLSNGNVASVRTLKSGTVDLYRIEDYFGVYYANPATERWERTSTPDYFEIQYQSKDNKIYFVRLVASKDYSTWNTRHFNSQFPRKIDITMGQGDKVFATAVLNTELVQDQSITMSLTFQATKYKVENSMKATNDIITDDVKVYFDNREIVNAQSVVNGKNLVNYDEMYDDIKATDGHYDDDSDEYIEGDSDKLIAHFLRASATADIIGKLQVNAKANGFNKLKTKLEEDEWVYWIVRDGNSYSYIEGKVLSNRNGNITYTHTDKSIVEDKVRYVSNYIDAHFCYDKTKTIQGYLGFDLGEWTDDYYWEYKDEYGEYLGAYYIKDETLYYVYRDRENKWDDQGNVYPVYSDWYYTEYFDDGNIYEYRDITVPASEVIIPESLLEIRYEVLPVIVFPDQTNFAFEDYFDEVTFKKLIDDYNDIIDTYLSITGQE